MLGVIRHASQLANQFTNECGWCVALMLILAYLGLDLTLAQLISTFGVHKGQFTPFYTYTNDAGKKVLGLNDIFARFKLNVAFTNRATWDWYLRMTALGIPVIALVAYRKYGDIGHFVIVKAASEHGVVMFDPLSPTGPTVWTAEEFRRAISIRSKYTGGTNGPHQAMYLTNPFPGRKPSRPASVILDELQDAAIAIQAEAAGRAP
jgi:ABC-type bacteriocin/lantibiotic exporter with double-glycine peptidase domain